VEASIQRGLRTPKGSRDSSTGRSCWTESRATGLSYGIPRSRGEPGYGGGAADRTGSKRRSAGQRRDRSGALIFQRWPGNGKSLEGSERPFRAAGSSRGELAGGLRSAEPSFYKRSGWEQRMRFFATNDRRTLISPRCPRFSLLLAPVGGFVQNRELCK